jgi:PEP-CTERM motif
MNISIVKRLMLAGFFACLLALPGQAAQLITNGGFEPGFTGWVQVDQLGSDSSWFSQTGATSPVLGDPVPAPPQGSSAAMTDGGGPGSKVLYQDFTVSASAASFLLSFQVYLNNQAAAFSTPASLDFSTPALNQQFRVDIISTAADPFSVAGSDILQAIYQTSIGDPLTSGYNTITADVTALLNANVGQTLRLRFAQADNVNIFHTGIDDVSLASADVPEPSTIMVGFGLVTLAILRCRRQ